ncbi:MAG: hypothetical protein ABSC62_01130 [Terracidiphilus sp.]|jgi:hypothetical protein
MPNAIAPKEAQISITKSVIPTASGHGCAVIPQRTRPAAGQDFAATAAAYAILSEDAAALTLISVAK